jgi:hypothetical protein
VLATGLALTGIGMAKAARLPAAAAAAIARAMHTISGTASVRLYHLDEGDGGARTLLYGSLEEALALARRQPPEVQAGLFLATESDVVAFLDLDEG